MGMVENSKYNKLYETTKNEAVPKYFEKGLQEETRDVWEGCRRGFKDK